jgi:hypothetical protein
VRGREVEHRGSREDWEETGEVEEGSMGAVEWKEAILCLAVAIGDEGEG